MHTTATVRGARERGFTLIEMLIAVIIIGLLVTMVIANLASAREKAYDRVAVSDLRNAMLAAEGYFADNLTYPNSPEEAGITPSAGVTFSTWSVSGGVLHIHAEHERSTHLYHLQYPSDNELEQRMTK